MELAFAVGNDHQVHVMFPVAVFRNVEWKDFVVFKTKTLTLMDGFKFSNLGVSENLRENWSPAMSSSQKKILVVQSVGVLIYSMKMSQDTP